MTAVFAFFGKPRADKKWDIFLRTGGVAALIAIPLALYLPSAIPLVWLGLVSIPANSPLSPIIPTAFEPMIMLASKYSSVMMVTLVATSAYMYMEFVNWHVYSWALNWNKLQKVRDQRWVRWAMEHFSRSPFAVTVFFALTPMPFWAARCLAILENYPIKSFMTATLVGRLPRLLLYAWIGEKLLLPTPLLIGFALGTGAIIITLKLFKGEKLLGTTVLDDD